MSSSISQLERTMKILRRSEQAWRELVERQAHSGLSVQAFCRDEGVSPWGLYQWRSRLRGKRKRGMPVPAGTQAAVSASEPAKSGFIDLGALGPSRTRCEIRLDLGGGVVLQVVRS
jgi:hypothetical protein